MEDLGPPMSWTGDPSSTTAAATTTTTTTTAAAVATTTTTTTTTATTTTATATTTQRRPAERVSGGLVRFNTSNMPAARQDRDDEVQQRIAGLTRARSLKRGSKVGSGRLRKLSGSFPCTSEVIKFDCMLVRVETAQQQPLAEEYDENESLKVSTRTADKWREYLVVCRESAGDPDAPLALRLYKTRRIPAVDRQHVPACAAHDTIPLNARTTRVNLYSSLDKTLVLWLPHKRGTIIYILRPRCASASVEWYTFLRAALGEPPCRSLQISVPDLSLTIALDNPFERRRLLQVDAADRDNITAVGGRQPVARSLLERSLAVLADVDEWKAILSHWGARERMGLAWRRYDRLEWVHGPDEERMDGSMAMQKTHELELRPKTHYPTECVLADSGERMVEPAPIEGFLVRLTSRKGRERRLGWYFRKRLYYSCHDKFLCFCQPSRALPPAIPAPPLPLVHELSPYPLNQDGEISWLAGAATPTPAYVEMKDQEAYEEAERNVNMLLRAEGFVDLTLAVGVRRMQLSGGGGGGGGGGSDSGGLDGCMDQHSGEDDRGENGEGEAEGEGGSINADGEVDEERCFEILLENGLVLKLQVRSI